VRKFTIGRDKGCDVLIGDESVSRVHAEIWLEGGTVMIADRGSSNGTSLVRREGLHRSISAASIARIAFASVR